MGIRTDLEVKTSSSKGCTGRARPTKNLVDEGAKRNRVVRIGTRVGRGGRNGRSKSGEGRGRRRPYGEKEFESGVLRKGKEGER